MTMSWHLCQHERNHRWRGGVTACKCVKRCIWLVSCWDVLPPGMTAERREEIIMIITAFIQIALSWQRYKMLGKNNQRLVTRLRNHPARAGFRVWRRKIGERDKEGKGLKSQLQVLPLGRLLVLAPVRKKQTWGWWGSDFNNCLVINKRVCVLLHIRHGQTNNRLTHDPPVPTQSLPELMNFLYWVYMLQARKYPLPYSKWCGCNRAWRPFICLSDRLACLVLKGDFGRVCRCVISPVIGLIP